MSKENYGNYVGKNVKIVVDRRLYEVDPTEAIINGIEDITRVTGIVVHQEENFIFLKNARYSFEEDSMKRDIRLRDGITIISIEDEPYKQQKK